MRKVNVSKRGRLFQYKIEIESQVEKRQFKSKQGFNISAPDFVTDTVDRFKNYSNSMNVSNITEQNSIDQFKNNYFYGII